MTRELATIVIVGEIKPIKDADFIEIATIEGKAWQCVVKKGEVQAGDKVVYMEIDSFLPEEPRYEFLRKSSYRKMMDVGGFRLKTAKFKGEVAQGLMLPLDEFQDIADAEVGEDVTERLGIKLFEPPIPACLAGVAKGNFPNFISRSNQVRIQNLVDYFEDYKDVVWEVSVKKDGSSFSSYCLNGEFGVCSHNLELVESESNTFWKVANQLSLKERLSSYGRNIMIQGELCGEGIQKNRDMINGHNVFVYDIFDIDKYKYVGSRERFDILGELNRDGDEDMILHVPLIGLIKVFEEYPDFDSIMAFSDGETLSGKPREGIVCKSVEPYYGRILSFKVISNKYLLKNGE